MKPICDACRAPANSVLTVMCPTEHARSFVMCFQCLSVVIVGHVQGHHGPCAECQTETHPVAVHPIVHVMEDALEQLTEAAEEDLAAAGMLP